MKMPWEVQSAAAKPLASAPSHDVSLPPSLASSAQQTSVLKSPAPQPPVPQPSERVHPEPSVPQASQPTPAVPKVTEPKPAHLKPRVSKTKPSRPVVARALRMPFTFNAFKYYAAHRKLRELELKPPEAGPLPMPSGFSSPSENKAYNDLGIPVPDPSAAPHEAKPTKPAEHPAATEAASGTDAEPRRARGVEAAAAAAAVKPSEPRPLQMPSGFGAFKSSAALDLRSHAAHAPECMPSQPRPLQMPSAFSAFKSTATGLDLQLRTAAKHPSSSHSYRTASPPDPHAE
eukprot:m51a1_g6514 hypothetical protein (288) ;mRNA; f:259148-260308